MHTALQKATTVLFRKSINPVMPSFLVLRKQERRCFEKIARYYLRSTLRCAKKGRKKVAISACGKYQLQTQLRRASCGRNCVLFAPFARIAQHVLKASVSYGWVTCCLKQTLPDPWHRMGHTCCFTTLLRASRLGAKGHYLRSALASHVPSKDAISVHAKQGRNKRTCEASAALCSLL
jgi:hypothetical protein